MHNNTQLPSFYGCRHGGSKACPVCAHACTSSTLVLWQASKMVGGNEAVMQELLPQLVPLFLVPPDQRPVFGSTLPPAAPQAQDTHARCALIWTCTSTCSHGHLALTPFECSGSDSPSSGMISLYSCCIHKSSVLRTYIAYFPPFGPCACGALLFCPTSTGHS